MAHGAPQTTFPSISLFHVVQVCQQTQLLIGNSFPCLKVELDDVLQPGFAIVPSPGSSTVLLVPTRKLSGIESPELLSKGSPNWWKLAWTARSFLIDRTEGQVSREHIGLAINSREARSQDQLHIHVGCVDRRILNKIRLFERAITLTWSTFPIRLSSQTWLAIRVEEENLESNPFLLLANLDPGSRGPMGDWGIATLAWEFADGSDGFLIFAGRYSKALAEDGSGASLLDQKCASGTGRP